MRRPSPFRDRPHSVELQLTPLIDCVFLLLVYFLWSSSFAPAERSLPSELSAAAGAAPTAASVPPPEADFDDLVIRVLRTGSGTAWQVNDAPVPSLAELRTMIDRAHNNGEGVHLADLEAELKRARIVPAEDVPRDVVTMNSKVLLYDLDTREREVFTLVYPWQADADNYRISVLAPVGTAMIGCRVGDVIKWPVPAGIVAGPSWSSASWKLPGLPQSVMV